MSRIRRPAYHQSIVLTIAEAAKKMDRSPETLRRWIRSGRLPARRIGRHQMVDDRDLRTLIDELFPMAELPAEWQFGDDGSAAPNWVAAVHRSRTGH
jgi:excisionase family DNA binding protein